MGNIFGIILTTLMVSSVFFGPPLVKYIGAKFGKIDAKIVLLGSITVFVMSSMGLISMLPLGTMGKVVVCLLSAGFIILMTLSAMSLMLIVTIPEDMEIEAENDKD